MSRQRRALVGGLAVAALVVAGVVVGLTRPWHHSPGDPWAGVRFEPVAAHVPAPKADRDTRTVERKLAALDPCALMRAARPGLRWVPTQPRSCTGDAFVLTLGDELPQSARFTREPMRFAGALGYLEHPEPHRCSAYLPVSQTLTVSISGLYQCGGLVALMRSVARELRHPGTTVLLPAGTRTRLACDLIRSLGPDRLRHLEVRGNTYSGRPMDSCGAWPGPEGSGGLTIEPVTPRVGVELRGYDSLRGRFQGGGWSPVFRTVSGHAVHVEAHFARECMVTFTAGHQSGETVLADVTAHTCPAALSAVRSMLTRAPIRPPRPTGLLYTGHQSDTPATGACVDLNGEAALRCAPYTRAQVPDTARQLLASAQEDPDVLCAAAAGAVRDALGRTLRPVTAQVATSPLSSVLDQPSPSKRPVRQCVFVEPTHSYWVELQASTTPMPDDSRSRPVAGHRAEPLPDADASLEPKNQAGRIIALTGAGQPGWLRIAVYVAPTRTDGWWNTSPVDRAPLHAMLPLATDLTHALLDDAS